MSSTTRFPRLLRIGLIEEFSELRAYHGQLGNCTTTSGQVEKQLQNSENGPVLRASASAVFLLSGIFLSVFAGAWGQSAATSAAAQNTVKAEEVTRGKKVYNAQCEICHFSATAKKKIGPGLKGLYKRGVYANGKKVDDASLSVWIEKGGKDMPGFKGGLTASEIRDLVAYIKTF